MYVLVCDEDEDLVMTRCMSELPKSAKHQYSSPPLIPIQTPQIMDNGTQLEQFTLLPSKRDKSPPRKLSPSDAPETSFHARVSELRNWIQKYRVIIYTLSTFFCDTIQLSVKQLKMFPQTIKSNQSQN